MLILHVTYRFRDDARDAFLKEIRDAAIDAAIRAENGCRRYDYYLSTEGSPEVLLVEMWDSPACQEKHLRQPHMAPLAAIKNKYVSDTIIEKFVV